MSYGNAKHYYIYWTAKRAVMELNTGKNKECAQDRMAGETRMIRRASSSPLSPSIDPSLFHSRLKSYLFQYSFTPHSLQSSTHKTSDFADSEFFLISYAERFLV